MSISVLIPIIVGLVAGYVTNYLADVLPATRRLSNPTCTHCNHPLRFIDYITLKPCTQCGQRRGNRHWFTLVILALISTYLWNKHPQKLGYWISLLTATYLAVVFVIDLEHRLILHPTSIVGSLIGLLAGWLNHGLIPTLTGGLGGFLIMLVLYYFGVLFSRIRARKMEQSGQIPDDEEALGAGDVILAGILGFMLGWPLIWFGLLLGILLGGFIGLFLVIFLLVVRKYKDNALMVFMPYGPFFIASAFFILFLPNWIAPIVPR